MMYYLFISGFNGGVYDKCVCQHPLICLRIGQLQRDFPVASIVIETPFKDRLLFEAIFSFEGLQLLDRYFDDLSYFGQRGKAVWIRNNSDRLAFL